MQARVRVLIGAALLSAAALPAAPAVAQSSAAERCRALPTEQERFACMEEALAAAEAALREAQEPESDRGFLGLGIGGRGSDLSGPQASDSPAAQELGAEQVAALTGERDAQEQEERQRVHATVVAFRERVPGQLMFELDNGQIWRQTDGDTQRLRLSRGATPEVEMWATRLGGYRMHFLEMDRVLMVQRME